MLESMLAHRITSAVVGLVLLAGCGSAPAPVGPTGIDGLEIPTPSPTPSEFVSEVTNPWLAWSPGATWEYATTDTRGRSATYTVTIQDSVTPIAGVDTTAAETALVLDRSGAVLAQDTTYAAQDREGNVWQFGRDSAKGDWRVGVDGASAGLLMPATPRVGDGFVTEHVPGHEPDRYTVLDLAGEPAQNVTGARSALVLERRSPAQGDLVMREYYRRGAGLVARDAADDRAEDNDLTLTERSPVPG